VVSPLLGYLRFDLAPPRAPKPSQVATRSLALARTLVAGPPDAGFAKRTPPAGRKSSTKVEQALGTWRRGGPHVNG
jgi:hypothetical protein